MIAGDIGSPLSDLGSLAVDAALLSDAAFMLKTHDPLEQEIEAENGMTGMQVVARLREHFAKAVPAIILTGDISNKTLNYVQGRNLIRLAKPVRAVDLEQAMQTLFDVSVGDGLAQAVPTAARGNTTNTVFVVDDDDDLLQVLRMVLEKHELVVETYASCEEFLNANHPRDDGCLLVDGYLPGMSGLKLLQRLKDNVRQLQSIMMTDNSDVTMAVRAMKAGA